MSMSLISFLFVSFLVSILFVHYVVEKGQENPGLFLGFSVGDIFLAVVGILAAGFVFGYMARFTHGKYAILHEPERWFFSLFFALITPLFILWLRNIALNFWNYRVKPIIDDFKNTPFYM